MDRPGVDWITCGVTKDVENGGRKSGGERQRDSEPSSEAISW